MSNSSSERSSEGYGIFADSWRSLGSERDHISSYYLKGHEKNKEDKLPFSTYFGYGFGGIAQYIYSVIFGFFMTPFLIQVAQISPFATGTIQLVVTVWTALMGPLIGTLSDISPHPRRFSWILSCKYLNFP